MDDRTIVFGRQNRELFARRREKVLSDGDVKDPWGARRRQLLEEVTSSMRKRFPNLSWKTHSELVEAEVDARLLYERYGREP